jgi:hypothetical protein
MRQVKEYGTQIFLLSMGGKTAPLILEEAEKLGYSWPEYAWIVLGSQSGSSYPKGVFLVHDFPRISLNHFLSFFLNGSLEEFGEAKHLNTVSIAQFTDSSEDKTEIAQYNSTLKQLIITYNLTASGNIPDGRTVVLEYHDSKIGIAVVVIVFVGILTFITIILIAYVYFRNEPEIKATSFSVSLCMFLGCYLMLLFVPFLLMDSLPDGQLGLSGALICNTLVILSAIGIPCVLILASLFVKMARVYAIFINPLSYKQRFFSNTFLFLYISLIVFPTLLILIIWMALDAFKNVSTISPKRSHEILTEKCEADYVVIWINLLLLYVAIVCLALLILALKSSKIRYKNFQDTKATNAFTFLINFTVTLTVMYWFLLRSFEPNFSNSVSILIPLYITHFKLPLLCQVLLFVPKVYPPVKRHLFKEAVKSKGSVGTS